MVSVKRILMVSMVASVVLYGTTADAALCKQGSSVSIEKIKSQYRNCTNCNSQKDSKGKKVYYCYCECAGASQSSPQKPKEPATASSSCTKQGSSQSIDWIKKKYKNSTNCGTQKNGDKKVYYCYCGDGCKASSGSSSSSGKSSSTKGGSETKVLSAGGSSGNKSTGEKLKDGAKDVVKGALHEGASGAVKEVEKKVIKDVGRSIKKIF